MDELERFKTNVNLSELAASRGYALDRRESSRNSAVMRHPNGDKIIIARNEGGAWMYFSVRDDGDHGTAIDFLQRREGGSLGSVRKILRDWLGSSRPPVPEVAFARDLFPVSRDRAAVLAAWEKAQPCLVLPYLTSRGIGLETLSLPLFAGCLRVDARGNALFPHYDRQGLCGFEMKNQGFTGFASGGIKGLWFSRSLPSDRCLVVAESAIDAISHAILKPDPSARYMSTGGTLNPQQPALLRGAFEKMPQGSLVILAFDNDEGGEKLAAEVRGLAPSSVEVRRGAPSAKDWNQELKNRLGLD